MMEVDDSYFARRGRARTGCGRNCCVTLCMFCIAAFLVLTPYWILNAAQLDWYWVAIIDMLIPVVLIVIACVCCCACCRNHDMVAWYKTRNIQKELRRRRHIGRQAAGTHNAKG